MKPRTDRRKTASSDSSAIARGSPNRSPATCVAVAEGDRVGDLVQRPGGGDRVVAESLGGEQSPVGLEADLPQCGQVPQPFADPKSRVSLIVVSVLMARWSLWYCLILECL